MFKARPTFMPTDGPWEMPNPLELCHSGCGPWPGPASSVPPGCLSRRQTPCPAESESTFEQDPRVAGTYQNVGIKMKPLGQRQLGHAVYLHLPSGDLWWHLQMTSETAVKTLVSFSLAPAHPTTTNIPVTSSQSSKEQVWEG